MVLMSRGEAEDELKTSCEAYKFENYVVSRCFRPQFMVGLEYTWLESIGIYCLIRYSVYS